MVLKPARVQGNNLSAALLLQKYSGSPLRGLLECGLGPARVWAWGLLECGPSSSKNTRGPPCGACSSVCSAPPSSSKNTRAKKSAAAPPMLFFFPPPPQLGQRIWGYRFENFGGSAAIFFKYTFLTLTRPYLFADIRMGTLGLLLSCC